jgi:NOL1/NOP2/fmu family ribosome biogenesis protein
MKYLFLFSFLVFTVNVSFSQGGIVNNRIFRATSADGVNWIRDKDPLFKNASEPGAIKNTNGNIVLYNISQPDTLPKETLTVATSNDGLNFSNQEIINVCCSSIKNRQGACPVLIPNEGIRLYYVNADDSIPKDIYSGFSSSGGVVFTEQSGLRFSKNNISDPDLFIVDTTWIMFSTVGTTLLRATSANGIRFKEDTTFQWNKGGMTSTQRFSNDIYRTYFCDNGVIKSATSKDGYSLKIESGIRIQSETNEVVSKPSVIELGPNSYVMYYQSLTLNTGVKETENVISVSVCPNPFKERTIVRVENSGEKSLSLMLFNLNGEKVKMIKCNAIETEFILDRTNLVKGAYLYSITTDEKIIATGKLIVE